MLHALRDLVLAPPEPAPAPSGRFPDDGDPETPAAPAGPPRQGPFPPAPAQPYETTTSSQRADEHVRHADSRPDGAPRSRFLRRRPARPAPVPALALVCTADVAEPLAVATGSLLAAHARTGVALACVWTPDPDGAPGTGGPFVSRHAGRLAAALAARHLAAEARGRTALATLPAAPSDAVVAARRALATAGTAPTVVVLGGPRDETLDTLLGEQDLVVVLSRGGDADPLAVLALAGLAGVAPRAVARPLALRPAMRTLARSGLAVPASVRSALRGPLGDLR